MAQHEIGKMDITEQEKTFDGFIRLTVRTVIVIIVTLVFIALVNG